MSPLIEAMAKTRRRASTKRRRQTGKGKTPPALYHGSPHSLQTLEPHVPRGETAFQTQRAVFLTSGPHQAGLYALARNAERRRKGWGIHGDQLYLVRNHWTGPAAKYALNPVGYRHVVRNTGDAVQNPDLPTEWVIPHAVRVNAVEPVTPNNYRDRIHYVTRDELYALGKA